MENEYFELKEVIANEKKEALLCLEIIKHESSESILSSLDMLSTDSNSEAKYLDILMDEKTADTMMIPTEIIDIICPTERAYGVASFEQVCVEKPLCEEILAMEKALSIMADYGKMFFKPKFRFEFMKSIAQWKLLLPERLKSIAEQFVTLSNLMYGDYSIFNQGQFVNFMTRLEL